MTENLLNMDLGLNPWYCIQPTGPGPRTWCNLGKTQAGGRKQVSGADGYPCLPRSLLKPEPMRPGFSRLEAPGNTTLQGDSFT